MSLLPPVIHTISTRVPGNAYEQSYAMERMKGWIGAGVNRRLVYPIYARSGIRQRHSVLPDFQPGEEALLFQTDEEGRLIEPGTGERNRVYEQSCPPLLADAAQAALNQAPWIHPEDITHIITTSCTGFSNPGPDQWVAHLPGIRPDVQRFHLGFMGCSAALPALRMAQQFATLDSTVVVLIACVELCSIHLQIKPTPDSIMANALFGDGAAAALVSARPVPSSVRVLQPIHFSSRLLKEGQHDMAWTIGNRGFDMTLTSYVPRILSMRIPELREHLLGAGETPTDFWAIHPGGRAIVDGLQTALSLSDSQVAHSREILSRYGNMSSPTLLFVLEAMLRDTFVHPNARIASLAFAPGLSIESAMFLMRGPPALESHA